MTEFFEYFTQRYPVYAPFTTPSYSNAAFSILGVVIENVTNEPYERVLKKTIFEPLSLTGTSVRKPEDSQAVIPIGNSSWSWDLGADNP